LIPAAQEEDEMFLAGKLTQLQQARFLRDRGGASRRVIRICVGAVRLREKRRLKEKATQLLRGLP
jgi:hypothetical protein